MWVDDIGVQAVEVSKGRPVLPKRKRERGLRCWLVEACVASSKRKKRAREVIGKKSKVEKICRDHRRLDRLVAEDIAYFTVEIPKAEHDDVQSVKRSLQALLNIPRFRLRLVHGEMVLEDGASVASLVDVKLVVKAFTTDSQASASLITHSIQGRASEVESLLEEPQDPNLFGARGFTALMHASAQGHLEVMRLLLEAMAEPNLAASSGATALFDASHQGQDEAARLLLEARADVNAKSNNGVTALMNAIFHGKAESSHLRLLLEARADVNVKSNNGVTPLMNAAFRGNAESARLLLEARANMNEVANNGATAMRNTYISRDIRSTRVLLDAQVDVRPSVACCAMFSIAMLLVLFSDAIFIYWTFAPGSSLQHVVWAVLAAPATASFFLLLCRRRCWLLRLACAIGREAVRRVCRRIRGQPPN
ncbi:unnamed protein product [Symbiodinium microadriaticum]|nr:unnamed protein product [Symbiodinium microadriaticum]